MPLFWLILCAVILFPCVCFLILAVSPRLFDQGSQWFTLTYLHQALTGATAVALVNSLWVSCAAALLGLLLGLPVAWLAARTTIPGRRFVSGGMWLSLLLPSWLPALGWERLVQQQGVMYRIGLDWPLVTHLIMGPFGVVLLLGLRCVPFSYLAVSAALGGLRQEFEDAARVHGASRAQALRLIVPILAPAIWSALAILPLCRFPLRGDVPRAARSVRVRQDDAAAVPGRHRANRQRADLHRRTDRGDRPCACAPRAA